jgi:nucleotide-binding universal stress UspA family protein
MFKHIVLPTDGSKLSANGAKQTIKMAKALGANITVVHVVSDYYTLLQDEGFATSNMPTLKKLFEDRTAIRAKEILGPVKEAADKAGVECDTVVAIGEKPYEMIIEQAKKSKCDLIIMASHARKGIQGILFGSETAKVLSHSKIPVLVLR